MPLSQHLMTIGRIFLSASALVIFAALPEVVATTSSAHRLGLIVGAVAFAVVWLWFWWWGIGWRHPAATPAALAVMTVLLALLTYLAPPGRDALLLAALAAGAGLYPSRALPVVVAIAFLAGAVQVVHGTPSLTVIGGAVNVVVVGVGGIGGRLLLTTNRELMRARDEIAQLAVDEERLRFARDLHDLLGQDLTLAVLKSELLARDLPKETPAPLLTLLADLAATVRQALDDVRAAAAGYRRLDLETEIAAAKSALNSAKIELTLVDDLGRVPPIQEDALAWTLRESVTNVLRHSEARNCTVRLRREELGALIEIEDDGRGASSQRAGSGLRGIAERSAALGGSFDSASGNGSGFRVRVSVPLPLA